MPVDWLLGSLRCVLIGFINFSPSPSSLVGGNILSLGRDGTCLDKLLGLGWAVYLVACLRLVVCRLLGVCADRKKRCYST